MRRVLLLIALLLAVPVAADQTRSLIRFTTVNPPVPQTLFQPSNLVYDGAFRISNAGPPYNFIGDGGGVMAYWPAHNSLIVINSNQNAGEISIPTAVNGAIGSLPFATTMQAAADFLGGQRGQVNGDPASATLIGGIAPLSATKLVVSVWRYYDAGEPVPCGVSPLQPCKQTLSHFVVNMTTHTTFASIQASDVAGPYQVGTGYQYVTPTDTYHIGGFVSGYMHEIPAVWQARLGGDWLTGNGGGVAIVSRTSNGPGASSITIANVGVTSPVPVAGTLGGPLIGFPEDRNGSGPLQHPDLGAWSNTSYPLQGSPYWYNGDQVFKAMIMPNGYDSVIWFGYGGFAYLPTTYGTGFCYGPATLNPALHQTDSGVGGHPWCFDPVQTEGGGLGVRPYPEFPMAMAVDLHELAEVKAGTKSSWDVRPYASWEVTGFPTSYDSVNSTNWVVQGSPPANTPCWQIFGTPAGFDIGHKRIYGVAHDPVTKRIWMALALQEKGNGDCTNNKPLILQYHY